MSTIYFLLSYALFSLNNILLLYNILYTVEKLAFKYFFLIFLVSQIEVSV